MQEKLLGGNKKFMKKDNVKMEDELRPEYDLMSLKVRKVGPERKSFFGTTVRLETDVAKMFPDSESVNEALRFLIRTTQKNKSSFPGSTKNTWLAKQLEVGFKSFDAMHIACAESEKADVFLTTDDKLLKLAKRNKNKLNVDIANPVLWLTERLFVAVNPMMTIFIGGSRRITRLSKAIQSRLDNIIDKG